MECGPRDRVFGRCGEIVAKEKKNKTLGLPRVFFVYNAF